MTDDLSDDELLNVPLGNLRPGELRRAFVVQTQHIQKVEEAENARTVSLAERRQQDEQKQEEEHEQQLELHEREARLRELINEREDELRIEAEEQDKRAIRLTDDRRVYVDGDKYRDEEGHELKGADRAQAEQEHLEHPDATTWQEHENLNRKWQETEKLKKDVENLQNGAENSDADQKLTAYEKQLQTARDAELAKYPNGPDYGSGDYSAELSGLASAFQTNAAGATPPAAPVQARLSDSPKSAAPII